MKFPFKMLGPSRKYTGYDGRDMSSLFSFGGEHADEGCPLLRAVGRGFGLRLGVRPKGGASIRFLQSDVQGPDATGAPSGRKLG